MEPRLVGYRVEPQEKPRQHREPMKVTEPEETHEPKASKDCVLEQGAQAKPPPSTTHASTRGKKTRAPMFVMNRAATQKRQGSGILRMCLVNWSIVLKSASSMCLTPV